MKASLDQQLQDFQARRLIAMPIAGSLVWLAIAVAGLTVSESWLPWCVFIGCGSIVYIGALIAPLTGENVFKPSADENRFDALFLLVILMSWLVFGIAIPFFLIEPTSITLSVGILTGILWIPMTWLLQHWIGIVHGVSRTVFIIVAWYAFPDYRYVAVPLVIVTLYLFAIVVLELRWRAYHQPDLSLS